MKEAHPIEDLENFIHESKRNKINIVRGYPFSGKKHLLYEILNKNDLGDPFSIIYHKNIILDEKQGKEINSILEKIKKRGIDTYEFEDFNKNKYKIKGKTVFLLLPSKIFIDDNEEYINNEKKEFKDTIEELKKNNKLITVTRDDMYKYLFVNREKTDSSKLRSIIKKLVKFLRRLIKKKDKTNIPEEDKYITEVLCNEDGANRIINNKMPQISKDMRDKILRYAKINYGCRRYKNHYFPGLIAEGIDNIDNIDKERIDNIENFEKGLAVESSGSIALGMSATNLPTSSPAGNVISDILKKIAEKVGISIPYFIPWAASFGTGLGAAFLTILFTNPQNKSSFGKELEGWTLAWRNMPQERKEYFAYQCDMSYNITPGEALYDLNNKLGRGIEKIKEEIKEELKKYFDGYIKEIKDLEKQIDEIFKGMETPENHGLKTIINENDLKDVFPEVATYDEKNLIVGLNDSNGSKDVKEMASDIIKKSENNNITFITGEPGAGKSTMLYIIGRKLLNDGKEIYIITDVEPAFDYIRKTKNVYYFLYDIKDKETAESFRYRVNGITNPNYSKVIVSVEECNKKSNIHLRTDYNSETCPIKHNDKVLNSIASEMVNKYLCSLNTDEKEEYITSIVSKANGNPLYISQAIKEIKNSER